MAEAQTPFKELFNPDAARWLAERMTLAMPGFQAAVFLGTVLPQLPALELKARVELLARTLVEHLPASFSEAAAVIEGCLEPDPGPPEGEAFGSFRYMPLSRVVSLMGMEEPERALKVLNALTRRFSAEFDIRFFLERYPEQTLAMLQVWAEDSDWRVRRLVSEGSRPRLPWGIRLQAFVADPQRTLPLLEKLKADPHSAVLRSVANHLNDIAKDHPEVVVETLGRWRGQVAPEAEARAEGMARHALRSLIKAGHPGAMKLIGFEAGVSLVVESLTLSAERVRVGDSVTLEVVLSNPTPESVRLLLDYAVHYRKASGGLSPKVFKWTTRTLGPQERLVLKKAHSFRPVSTRVLYPGLQRVEILVNGSPAGAVTLVLEP